LDQTIVDRLPTEPSIRLAIGVPLAAVVAPVATVATLVRR
jgi:hypothetical protein